ncbi:MAG: BatD family protein [Pseudidiomarina maritima]|nr:BatD family protein [Pseudidiomarina maritima]
MVTSRQLLMLASIVVVGLLSLPQALAEPTEVIASVDRNPVLAGQLFNLTVTVNDDIDQDEINVEQQLNQFRIVNSRSSRSTRVINGDMSRTTTFVFSLQAPQQVGTVTIPALSVGDVSSQPIELTLLASDQADALSESQPAFIRTSVESTQVYVQQQFKLVSRLYLAANLHSGNLIAPELTDAEITQFGQDQENYEIIDGKRYQVYQRTYLITPQRSGQFTLNGPMFEGLISKDSGRSIFSSMSTTEPVTASAEPIELLVQPIPSSWQGDWLPADLVTLTLETDIDPAQQLQQGQPLTLTLRTTAMGVSPDQLPALQLPDIAGVSIYPETPQLSQAVRNGNLIAQRSQTIAIIPRQGGTLELPSFRLPWFNTRTQQQQVASTDQLTFSVAMNDSATVNEYSSNPTDVSSAPSQTPSATEMNQQGPAASAQSSSPNNRLWYWLAALFAGLWVITLSLFASYWRRQQRQSRQPQTNATSATSDSDRHALSGALWQQLQQACQANQAAATDQALRAWANSILGQPIHDLTELSRHFAHPPLTSQINHLLSCRFGHHSVASAPNQATWQEGKALLRSLQAAYKNYVKSSKTKQQQNVLPALYPQ